MFFMLSDTQLLNFLIKILYRKVVKLHQTTDMSNEKNLSFCINTLIKLINLKNKLIYKDSKDSNLLNLLEKINYE